MGVTLERVQNKFACIIGELCSEPVILSQFAIWVDMRIAEYKANGVISLECSGKNPNPTWLKGHTAPPPRSKETEITQSQPHSMGVPDLSVRVRTECLDPYVVVKEEPSESEEPTDFTVQLQEDSNNFITPETSTIGIGQRANNSVFQFPETNPSSLQMCSTDSNVTAAHLTYTNIKTVDKPVSCDLCGSKFNSRKLMLRHQRRMHTEPSLSCSRCEKMFTRRDKLRAHEKSHIKMDLKIQSHLLGDNSVNSDL